MWITPSAAIEYKPEEHIPSLDRWGHSDMPFDDRAKKFLYWRDDGDGQPLLIVGGRSLAAHADLFFAARDLLAPPPPSTRPDGAGNIDGSGFVAGWSSLGFVVDTPESLIPELTKMLGVNEQ